MLETEVHSITVTEVPAPAGQRMHLFPLSSQGRVSLRIPRDLARCLVENEKVYREFFRMNGINNAPPLLRVLTCLRRGAVQFSAYNLEIIFEAPLQEVSKGSCELYLFTI